MPDEIAPGYPLEAELSPTAVRCVGPDGRRWVLKPVPNDCLYAGGLHPAIRDRLARVRELPHPRVATLAGVVRGSDGVAAHLVWGWVDGQPIGVADVSPDRFPDVIRGLTSAVETLHARGLVHGGLVPGNVIVAPDGDVWLTHVSPYLWDDPADDVRAVDDLLRQLADRLSIPPPPGLADGTTALRDVAARWTDVPPEPTGGRSDRRSLTAAAAVAAAAVSAAIAIAVWAGGRSPPGRPAPDGTGDRAAPAR